MKVYTKTGDQGSTSLVDGTRVPKYDARLQATGAVDELNAWIGLLAEYTVIAEKKDFLRDVQNRLFEIGSNLATEKKINKIPSLTMQEVEKLELEIDLMTASLQPMRYFILPGGHKELAFCHIARTVCRRAEREVWLMNETHPVDHAVLVFLNRLSDYIFTLCRYMALKLKAEEVPWIPKK